MDKNGRWIVLLWPNKREQIVKRSQVAGILKASCVGAVDAGRMTDGHDCMRVIAGDVRYWRQTTPRNYYGEKTGTTGMELVHG